MIGFISLQTAIGFFIIGFIMGFASSLGLAAYLVHRERVRYLKAQEELNQLPRVVVDRTKH